MNLLKTLLKRRLSVPIFVGFALSLLLILHFVLTSPIQQTSSVLPIQNAITILPKQEQVRSGLPVRLKIPEINVDAAVDPMGITLSGEMEAPTGPRNVGWYKFGPHPGNIGSAVIDGHFGRWKDGEGSVFDNLNKLRSGDRLYIQDAQGITNTFVVREIRLYNPNQDDADVFVSSDGKAHLNLITCEGVWNETQKSYSNRLIVFADKTG